MNNNAANEYDPSPPGVPEWFYQQAGAKNIQASHELKADALGGLDSLTELLNSGAGEQELQRCIKGNPAIMSGMYRTGHGIFAFSKAEFQLGGKYACDWAIAEGNSGGFSWELIEFESPKECPFMKSGHFSEATRKGINQVNDWRAYIGNNLSSVRNPEHEDGLGLYGISSGCHGLVVVGRNTQYNQSEGFSRYNEIRRHKKEESNIEIMSWERFIAKCRFQYEKQPLCADGSSGLEMHIGDEIIKLGA